MMQMTVSKAGASTFTLTLIMEIKVHHLWILIAYKVLMKVIHIVENCGEAYRNGSDTIKKLMNQAIFEKFYISNGENTEFSVDVTFRAPYDQILEPIRDDISSVNAAMNRSSAKVSKYIGIAKDHIRKIFGCGLYAVNNSTLYETSSNDSNFFEPKSSSKVLLVEVRGIEPLSENRLPRLSTSVVDALASPKSTPVNRL